MDSKESCLVVFGVFSLLWVTSEGQVSEAPPTACEWTICYGSRSETFSCNSALIFVESVSDYNGGHNSVAFKNIKQMCMGAKSCDPSRLCNGRYTRPFRIRYVCVNATSIEKECAWPSTSIWRRWGYIQSPSYPAAISLKTCSWRISAPEDRFVHVSVHDVTTVPVPLNCDSGLNITFQECSTGAVSSRLYCGQVSQDTEIIACGSVSVQLVPNHQLRKIRFWLSFEVSSSPEAAVEPPLSRLAGQCTQGTGTESLYLSSRVPHLPVLRPLDGSFAMDSTLSNKVSVTTSTADHGYAEEEPQKGVNITVVIIAVSVIGGVLIVAIILAIVFLKRPKVERIEHVYAVPTPSENRKKLGEQRNNLETDRPVLRDCYSDVVDAIANKHRTTPASPGYAEVQDVCGNDHCHWHPQRFTFGPPGRPKPPNNLSIPETTTHAYENVRCKHVTNNCLRNDYEDIRVDSPDQSPCFIHNDQKLLLKAKMAGASLLNKRRTQEEGVGNDKRHQDPSPVVEGPYASRDVVNHDRPYRTMTAIAPPGDDVAASAGHHYQNTVTTP